MKRKCGFTLVELLVVMSIIAIIIVLMIPAIQKARAASSPPALRGPVNDDAKILTEEEVKNLSNILRQYEKATTNQIVILTIPTLNGRDISEFAIETAKSWKLGQKDIYYGVLFVAAVKEHKTWITTGRGVGDKLTDADCRHILADKVKPRFKAGDYSGGIYGAITAIEVKLSGKAEAGIGANEVGAAGAVAGAAAVSFWLTGWGIFLIIVIVVVIAILIIAALSSFGGGGGGGLLSDFGGGSSSDSGGIFSGSSGSSDSGGIFSGGGGDFGGGGAGGDW